MWHRISPALRYTFVVAMLSGVYAALVKVADDLLSLPAIPWSSLIQSAIGVALGLLVALRINVAYARWWEARTLWGTLVNTSRNLAIKVRRLALADAAERTRATALIAGFAEALRDHLQGSARLQSLAGLDSDPAQPAHVPAYLSSGIYEMIARWHDQGRLDSGKLRALDESAATLLDVCGGCERIQNTPPPKGFRQLVRQILVLFVAGLPWIVVNEYGWVVVPVTIVGAYVVMACEGIARRVDHPFDPRFVKLDLDGLCRTIRSSVTEILDTAT